MDGERLVILMILEILIIALVLLWLFGAWSPYAFGGGLIHIVLVIAIILLLVRLFVGRSGRVNPRL